MNTKPLSVAAAALKKKLGGLSMMLLASVQGTTEARHRTVAVTQAYSLAELIALQSDAIGHYVNPADPQAPACEEDFCRDEAMAHADILNWQTHLARELPGATGLVCLDSTPDDGDASDPSCDSDGAPVVKIFWSEARHANAPDGGGRRVVSRLPW